MEGLHARSTPANASRGFSRSGHRTEPMQQSWTRPMPEIRKPADDISGFRLEALCYFLRNTKVFADLPEQDLRDLATVATIRFLEKGAYLFHKDETPPGLCLVRRGIVNFHRVAMDGREVVIHFYREGEVLPEIASESDSGCPADARAVVASEVVIIPRRNFLSKVRTCPELALRVLASMDQQVHQIADSLEDIVSKNASTRFVHWLLKQCGGPGSREAVEIDLGTTKRALASELGVRQETLSRTLRQLTESGHLRVRGRHITVKSPHALRKAWVSDARCAAAA